MKLITYPYTVDGLRIDTVKHVQKSFWPGYNSAAGVYCVGEVFDGDPAYTCPYQSYLDGVLNYPVYVPRCIDSTIADPYQLLSTSLRFRVNKWQHQRSLQHDQLCCI
jgi:alpha-amylase